MFVFEKKNVKIAGNKGKGEYGDQGFLVVEREWQNDMSGDNEYFFWEKLKQY